MAGYQLRHGAQPDETVSALFAIVLRCLCKEPERRLTARDALLKPFFLNLFTALMLLSNPSAKSSECTQAYGRIALEERGGVAKEPTLARLRALLLQFHRLELSGSAHYQNRRGRSPCLQSAIRVSSVRAAVVWLPCLFAWYCSPVALAAFPAALAAGSCRSSQAPRWRPRQRSRQLQEYVAWGVPGSCAGWSLGATRDQHRTAAKSWQCAQQAADSRASASCRCGCSCGYG